MFEHCDVEKTGLISIDHLIQLCNQHGQVVIRKNWSFSIDHLIQLCNQHGQVIITEKLVLFLLIILYNSVINMDR